MEKIRPTERAEHLLKHIRFGSEKYKKEGEFYIHTPALGPVSITKNPQRPSFDEASYKYFIAEDVLYLLWRIHDEDYYETAVCFCGCHNRL